MSISAEVDLGKLMESLIVRQADYHAWSNFAYPFNAAAFRRVFSECAAKSVVRPVA